MNKGSFENIPFWANGKSVPLLGNNLFYLTNSSITFCYSYICKTR